MKKRKNIDLLLDEIKKNPETFRMEEIASNIYFGCKDDFKQNFNEIGEINYGQVFDAKIKENEKGVTEASTYPGFLFDLAHLYVPEWDDVRIKEHCAVSQYLAPNFYMFVKRFYDTTVNDVNYHLEERRLNEIWDTKNLSAGMWFVDKNKKCYLIKCPIIDYISNEIGKISEVVIYDMFNKCVYSSEPENIMYSPGLIWFK